MQPGAGGGVQVTVTDALSFWPVSTIVAVLLCVPSSSSQVNVFVYVTEPDALNGQDMPFVSLHVDRVVHERRATPGA